MNALVCNNFGLPDSLAYQTINAPKVSENQVLIEVKACGVNFPDTLIIQNKYQFKPALPFSPGGEVSGIILETGNKVKRFKKGTRVLALCGWGGMAEQVVVDESCVFPLPPEIDMITAAGTLYNYGTSYYALKDRGQLKKEETILILGAAGGVGLAAVELAKLLGAKVIAAASSNEKLAICKSKGADHLINYTTEDLRTRLKEIAGDKGIDLVYDAVGGKYAEPALRSVAWNGRYLVVGFASGEIPQIPLNLALLKGSSIVGVFWGSFAEKEPAQNYQNLIDLIQWIKAGKIKQYIHRIYTLENSATALKEMLERKVIGKAIIKVGNWEDSLISVEEKRSEESDQMIPAQTESLPVTFKTKSDLAKRIGTNLGTTEWLKVDQQMINQFAETTRDFQWVHIDTEKAKKYLPGGKTMAHGYLTLSLASQFFYQLISIEQVNSFVNYGINKARFISPVSEGSEIRMRAGIANVEEQINDSVKLFLNCTIEIKGQDKPAYSAEIISMIF